MTDNTFVSITRFLQSSLKLAIAAKAVRLASTSSIVESEESSVQVRTTSLNFGIASASEAFFCKSSFPAVRYAKTKAALYPTSVGSSLTKVGNTIKCISFVILLATFVANKLTIQEQTISLSL
eukprot:NODE_102_length_19640_cov_1.308735.p13 type:complete len:123 gc:universal NODE_102_length_19640_cov_1.308735:17001-17369(+)